MYAWLGEALADDSSIVVTANRRLGRELHAVHAERQIEAGVNAWRRPAIFSWDEWLAVLVESGRPELVLPVRINAQQSRVVWEQSLRADIDDPLINIGSLARLCRDTWKRLHEWQVPLADCQSSASGQDQRIFARAAGRYDAHLRDRDWIDDALLPDALAQGFEQGQLLPPGMLVLAGFDRMTPQAARLVEAAVAAGAERRVVDADLDGQSRLVSAATADAELRTAGQWARKALQDDPSARIAIVVNDLEQHALRAARLLREGFVPGWQYADSQTADALNVSFGRRLADYAAIHDALLMLRFLTTDTTAADVSLLLRSPFFGAGRISGRARMELRLRDVPDRRWSKTALVAFLRPVADNDKQDDGKVWLERVVAAVDRLRECPQWQSAAGWAGVVDELLLGLQWPGDAALDSEDFQLLNRWRDLLNEFSRLDLVAGALSVDDAVARLESLASETIFQAEAITPVVNVVGVLEAAGMEFDQLWVTGFTASSWPPPGRPLALVSRELQQRHSMPDATPDDTTAFAERVVHRLSSSARDVVFSFPRLVGDAEQMPSALVAGSALEETPADEGWHATLFCASPLAAAQDPVPALRRGQVVAGGAATINRQCTDPLSAFAFGRLGVRWMPPFQSGIPARIRGNLVHDALQQLYGDRPTQAAIQTWTAGELGQRVGSAVEHALGRHRRFADPLLGRLLTIEGERCRDLLAAVVDIDRTRDSFRIESVESAVSLALGGALFELRCDRIDRDANGELIVIDYKTGARRRFLTAGEPADLQLVVYACALDTAIAGLALFNVDSRHTLLDGAGPAFGSGDDWTERLGEWKQTVRAAAVMIAAGDVRLNVQQNSREARPLDVLSRYAELRREA